MKITDTRGRKVDPLGLLQFDELQYSVVGSINDADWPSTFVKLTAGGGLSGGFDLTGITPPGAYFPPNFYSPLLIVANRTGYTMTVKNASASSATGHRINISDGADHTVTNGRTAIFLYDQVNLEWRWIAKDPY
jgi:hypothetical protein